MPANRLREHEPVDQFLDQDLAHQHAADERQARFLLQRADEHRQRQPELVSAEVRQAGPALRHAA